MRKDSRVAGSRRPSFLKRQKEQKRLAKALQKRDARQERRRAQLAESADPELQKPAEETPENPPETP